MMGHHVGPQVRLRCIFMYRSHLSLCLCSNDKTGWEASGCWCSLQGLNITSCLFNTSGECNCCVFNYAHGISWFVRWIGTHDQLPYPGSWTQLAC